MQETRNTDHAVTESNLPPTLSSERLHLRSISPEDAEDVFAYRSDADTNRYQGFIPKELEDVKEFIARNPKEWNLPDTWFQLLIVEHSMQSIIGDLGVHFLGDGMQCELGCTLSKAWHGKGYASEAMKLVMAHLFGALNKHRITASVDPDNTASIRMLERLGFRKEAHFKERFQVDDTWVDDLVFAVLQREWIF